MRGGARGAGGERGERTWRQEGLRRGQGRRYLARAEVTCGVRIRRGGRRQGRGGTGSRSRRRGRRPRDKQLGARGEATKAAKGRALEGGKSRGQRGGGGAGVAELGGEPLGEGKALERECRERVPGERVLGEARS